MTADLTCADVRDLLDIVAADAVAEVDLPERYPAVLAHLRRCIRCRARYFMLLDALRTQEEAASLLAAWRARSAPSHPALSFLEDEPEGVPARPQVPERPVFPLTFEIRRDVIRRALRGPRLEGVRGGRAASEVQEVFLFADWVPAPGGDWIAELVARRHVERPDVVDVEARLVTDEGFGLPVRVSLRWGEQRRSALLDADGTAELLAIPLAPLVDADRGPGEEGLTVRFDVDPAAQRDSA